MRPLRRRQSSIHYHNSDGIDVNGYDDPLLGSHKDIQQRGILHGPSFSKIPQSSKQRIPQLQLSIPQQGITQYTVQHQVPQRTQLPLDHSDTNYHRSAITNSNKHSSDRNIKHYHETPYQTKQERSSISSSNQRPINYKQDDLSYIPCSHCYKKCRERELKEHEDRCEQRLMSCQYCTDFVQRIHMKVHHAYRCRGIAECLTCSRPIPKEKLSRHMMKCTSRSQLELCMSCNRMIPLVDYSHHSRECQQRNAAHHKLDSRGDSLSSEFELIDQRKQQKDVITIYQQPPQIKNWVQLLQKDISRRVNDNRDAAVATQMQSDYRVPFTQIKRRGVKPSQY